MGQNHNQPRIPRDDEHKAQQGQSSQEQSREPRAAETSDSFARADAWSPPEMLPMPKEHPDWVYRYVRTATLGKDDPTNVSRSRREGWEPVKASEHPEIAMVSDDGNRDSVEIGGLILCRAPRKFMEQRKAYYEKKTWEQQQAVDNDLMKQNDARMPLDAPSRKSNVSFGRGE